MSIDYRQLRARLQIEEVLRWLSWAPSVRRGAQLRGRCPFCESVDTASVPSRIFSVNTQRNIYRCFKCGVSGNALDLWSTYHQLPLYTAAKELQAHVDQSSQPKNHS